MSIVWATKKSDELKPGYLSYYGNKVKNQAKICCAFIHPFIYHPVEKDFFILKLCFTNLNSNLDLFLIPNNLPPTFLPVFSFVSALEKIKMFPIFRHFSCIPLIVAGPQYLTIFTFSNCVSFEMKTERRLRNNSLGVIFDQNL